MNMTKIFTHVWNKYRPVILKMMVDCGDKPQVYKLSSHEFRGMATKPKSKYSFVLQVSKGKAINNIRESIIAQELLEILQMSKKASELTEEATYQFELDKQFMLHVTKLPEPNIN
jgi:hypothetical protein